jgi:hypothetical protein
MIKWLIPLLLLLSCTKIQNSSYINHELSQIEIGATNSVEEAESYHHLWALLKPQQQTKYLLNFTLSYDESTLAISKASDTLRKGLAQTLKFELIDKATNEVLLKDTIKLHSSYSLIIEPLVSYAQFDSNKKFLARRAAENLRYRLMVYFNKNPRT